jgi:hypothetical protein
MDDLRSSWAGHKRQTQYYSNKIYRGATDYNGNTFKKNQESIRKNNKNYNSQMNMK